MVFRGLQNGLAFLKVKELFSGDFVVFIHCSLLFWLIIFK
jgi:hypothetical protein